MAEFPALPLWTDALIGDTFHLTPAQFGAYMRLLIVAWRTPGCDLPSDDLFLGRAIGDPKNWHRLKAVVLAFFMLGADGRYRQKRLSDERDYVSRQAVKSSAGGRAKALKRMHRGSAKTLPNACLTSAPTPTPIKVKVSKKEEVDFPPWWPLDAWQGFVAMRRSIRAPMTPRAARNIVAAVARFKSLGDDPAAILDQSITNAWRGVFRQRSDGSTEAPRKSRIISIMDEEVK